MPPPGLPGAYRGWDAPGRHDQKRGWLAVPLLMGEFSPTFRISAAELGQESPSAWHLGTSRSRPTKEQDVGRVRSRRLRLRCPIPWEG